MIWTILGLSVGVLALFCITVAEFLVGKPIFEPYRPYAAIGLGVLGGAAWLLGRALSGRRDSEEGRRFVLFDLRYWGPMFLVMGVITLFIRPLRFTENTRVVVVKKQKVEMPAPKPLPPPVQVVKITPPVFPALKIGGLIYRDKQPVVILNGQSYTVGDQIGDVVVKAIDRTGVLLQMGGETKLLSLN